MKKKNVTLLAVGLLLLAVAFLAVKVASPVAEANPSQEYGVISVYGEAALTAEPDLARLTLAVETKHESAKKAAEENARLTNAVFEALTGWGLDKKQLKTSGYYLGSYTEQVGSKDKYVTKYRASNELNVSLHNLNEVGDVIDVAIQAGANRVTSVFFELQDAEALKLQALQGATKQAQAKAAAIARSAGVTIKGIKVIHEEMSSYAPFRAAGENLKMMDAASTLILPDDVEVTARVNVEYYF